MPTLHCVYIAQHSAHLSAGTLRPRLRRGVCVPAHRKLHSHAVQHEPTTTTAEPRGACEQPPTTRPRHHRRGRLLIGLAFMAGGRPPGHRNRSERAKLAELLQSVVHFAQVLGRAACERPRSIATTAERRVTLTHTCAVPPLMVVMVVSFSIARGSGGMVECLRRRRLGLLGSRLSVLGAARAIGHRNGGLPSAPK